MEETKQKKLNIKVAKIGPYMFRLARICVIGGFMLIATILLGLFYVSDSPKDLIDSQIFMAIISLLGAIMTMSLGRIFGGDDNDK
jgi:hypothetical protein